MKEKWWLFKNTLVIAVAVVWENIMEKVKRPPPPNDSIPKVAKKKYEAWRTAL
jgi:hypothetical protein